MGCDIHIVVERKIADGEWIGIWCSHTSPNIGYNRPNRRNYQFFAEVAGVRGRPEKNKKSRPRFIPKDISALAWEELMACPTDYHSHSHMSLKEFCEHWVTANPEKEGYGSEIRKDHVEYDLFGIDYDWPENAQYRVVFWFDN